MKKVLIIGAGFLQDFVICKAKKMGYKTYTVDANPNAVGFLHADYFEVIDITDMNACLVYAKKNKIDGVLTAATDYGVLTASFIARELNLPGLNYEVAQLIKNKYRVREYLSKNNVDDTEQAYEVDLCTNFDDLQNKVIYPVMVKPCDGSGSRGTSRVDLPEKLRTACISAINESATKKAEIESFILGKEYGVESLVINGNVHVLGIMKKWMTKPPYYAELGHAIPCGLSSEIQSKVMNCVKRAIEILKINHGSVNMDLLITDSGNIHIIDIGTRMGGNMIGPCIISYGTGIDYMGAMIKNALGEEINFIKNESSAVASRLLAFPEGDVKNIVNFEEVERNFDVEIYHHIKKGQHVNEYHTNIDGCGYIIARADTVDKAIEKADNALNYLRDNLF